MALAQQTQLQDGTGARNPARRLAGSPALRMVGRRLVATIVVLWGVTFLTYVIMAALPNDTAQSILGLNATPAQVRALNHTLGLDKPFIVQYWDWLVKVLHGDLGTAITTGASVNSELAAHLPVTLALLLYALVVSVAASIVLAVLAARKPNGLMDRFSLAVSMFGLSAAPYALAFLLIIIFAVKLNWFPVQSNSLGSDPLSFLRATTLPAASLGIPLFAIYTRLLRGDLVEQMQREDYIVTAKAKGVHPWRVLIRHALRNSMFSLITVVGLNLGGLIGAAAIIETIFSVPGIGQDLLNSIGDQDVPMIEGIVFVFALITVIGNLIADLMYAVLDPRIRYGRSSS